jgi:2-oxoglutarate dehydrogenase E1 component
MMRSNPAKDLVEAPPEVAAPGTAAQTRTEVPIERLVALNDALLSTPPGFAVNRKLERARDRRRQAFASPDERSLDWAAGEDLALASILEDGVAIRFTGEDVGRGTFSHRHAVLTDPNNGRTFMPLQALPQARAAFEIRNSPLSENAAIGFEYGYNIQAPSRLVIWEAQYGDFINGAQLMLDEFVLSARAKWGQEPSLVLLLPHGYEGQGPDHASARPERFLQLACRHQHAHSPNCTTAAQYFHLLRRQAALLERDPLPLVVLTPKSLLRHPAVASSPRDLAEGRWMTVIEDEQAAAHAADVRRLLFATGKVAVDLLVNARPRGVARRGDLPGGAVVSAARQRDAGRDRDVSEPRRNYLGAGRAGEHGRVGLRAAVARGTGRYAPAGRAGAPAQFEPCGRLGVASRAESGEAHRARVRDRSWRLEARGSGRGDERRIVSTQESYAF